MDEGPKVAAPSREALEELVYRPGLGDRVLPGPSRWLTVPVTLALAGAFGGMAFVMGRRNQAEKRVPQTVDVVLQEASAPAVRAPAAPAAPRPEPPAPRPAGPAAAPAPAPAPEVPLPPLPVTDSAPDTVPRELPKEDLSRQFGSKAAGGGLPGTGAPGAGGGPGGVPGGSGPPGQIVDLEIKQLKEKSRPPDLEYPRLAQIARIQGTVLVQITVGTDGVPITARALDGPNQLRAAAVSYGMGWRFYPHMENGVPTLARFNLSVTFRIK